MQMTTDFSLETMPTRRQWEQFKVLLEKETKKPSETRILRLLHSDMQTLKEFNRFHYMSAKSLQLCLILCDPIDCSPPGSSVHVIFQARILEWVDLSSSRGSSQPRDRSCVSCFLHCRAGALLLVPQGDFTTRNIKGNP